MLKVTALGLSKAVGSHQAEANNCLKVLTFAGKVKLLGKTVKVKKSRSSNVYGIEDELASVLFSSVKLKKLQKFDKDISVQVEETKKVKQEVKQETEVAEVELQDKVEA